MGETSDNMRIWDSVSKTDPAHTKKVNQRGGFTAISAHYQIMQATKQFGPIGIGWGYTNGDPLFQDGLVIVPVTIWHGDRANKFGPLYGSAEVFAFKKLDSDAPKKASTDGLTKGLSQLGFNADVFLGRFDDNKYVEQMGREFHPPEEAEGESEQRSIIDPKKGEERKKPKPLTGKHKTREALKQAWGSIVKALEEAADGGDPMFVDEVLRDWAEDILQIADEGPKAWTENPEWGLDAQIIKARKLIEDKVNG